MKPLLSTIGHQTTTFREYVDSGVDLIGLCSPNSDKDDLCLRAFGDSNLEDLNWFLEGIRATNVPDAYIAFKNASGAFVAINHQVTGVSIGEVFKPL